MSDWQKWLTFNNVILGLGIVCLVIGIIVACNIKSTDSDKKKGDMRLVAAVFIMSSLIFFASRLTNVYCKEGIRELTYDTTGYYYPNAAKAKAAGVKGY